MRWETKEALFGFRRDRQLWRNIVTPAAWAMLLFGGPLLGLAAIDFYPFLDPRTFTVACEALGVVFVLSFLPASRKLFPPGVPGPLRVVARAGWSLAFIFLCVGVIGISNGLDLKLETPSVQCVGKRMTRERNPGDRTYSLELLPWPGSSRQAEVDVPRDVFLRVHSGDRVGLVVGRGNLGIEWVQSVIPLQTMSSVGDTE